MKINNAVTDYYYYAKNLSIKYKIKVINLWHKKKLKCQIVNNEIYSLL